MRERTVSRIEEWDAQSFPGGYEALRKLADSGFSGVVRTRRGTWAFFLNGRIIGVFEGTIEDFEDSEGTIHEAPHPSLSLLFAMLEKKGEQRAKYYTNDTPIAQAHKQLSDASFTGYIELSENVLSGDYYVVYYGGRSMSCAFVGNAERLLTDDEAFERADDEVGIYQVRTVEVDVVEIPEPASESVETAEPASETIETAEPASESVETIDDTSDDAASPATEQSPSTASSSDQPGTQNQPPAQPDQPARQPGESAHPPSEATGGATDNAKAGRTDATAESPPSGGETPPADGRARRTPGTPNEANQAEPPAERSGMQPGTDDARTGGDEYTPGVSETGGSTAPTGGTEPGGSTAPTGGTEPHREARSQRPETTHSAGGIGATAGVTPVPKEQFESTRMVPSLAPDRTGTTEAEASGADEDTGSPAEPTAGAASGTSTEPQESPHAQEVSSEPDSTPTRPTSGATSGTRSPEEATGGAIRSSGPERTTGERAVDEAVATDASVGELRARLTEREGRIKDLEAQLADLSVQRDGLRDERDRLRDEVEQLTAEITDLENEVESLRSRLSDGTEGKRRLDPEEALRGTNLFVRYGSKSGGTLEKAHAGDVGKDEVDNNLRLEYHTQFDADEVAVDGQSFEEFLEHSLYKGFVDWAVRDLLYEIRETGHIKGLKDLYDALPDVDRAELLGDVSVEYTEDGEQYREQRTFDVVLRDRMGNPLVVADINDSRNPATGEMMSGVIENASEVKGSNDSLASALLVTASFFEPGALEAADEAAGGGLLGGSSRDSFVRLSRKRGYHLLLVETRAGEFHVNVPEL